MIPRKNPELIGKVFGKLTIIEFVKLTEGLKKPAFYAKCVCVCGETTHVKYSNLTSNSTVSCGCHRKKQWAKAYYAWEKQERR
jgi:hypothetical protein